MQSHPDAAPGRADLRHGGNADPAQLRRPTRPAPSSARTRSSTETHFQDQKFAVDAMSQSGFTRWLADACAAQPAGRGGVPDAHPARRAASNRSPSARWTRACSPALSACSSRAATRSTSQQAAAASPADGGARTPPEHGRPMNEAGIVTSCSAAELGRAAVRARLARPERQRDHRRRRRRGGRARLSPCRRR